MQPKIDNEDEENYIHSLDGFAWHTFTADHSICTENNRDYYPSEANKYP